MQVQISGNTEEALVVELFNAVGQKVWSSEQSFTNTWQISGANLPSGLYFIRLTRGGETAQFKMVRQ
jgi:hypothetical protein